MLRLKRTKSRLRFLPGRNENLALLTISASISGSKSPSSSPYVLGNYPSSCFCEVFRVSRKAILTLAVALISCLCAVSASAQRRTRARTTPAAERRDAPQETSQKEASQVPTEEADVAITATVTARELRFEVVPNPTVEFPGYGLGGRARKPAAPRSTRRHLPQHRHPSENRQPLCGHRAHRG
jgi:hypothetical protein